MTKDYDYQYLFLWINFDSACKMNGKDIQLSRTDFVHEIVVSALYSGDMTIGDMLVYEYASSLH